MLRKRSLEVLREMVGAADAGDHDAAEIVREGRRSWLGTTRISVATVDDLVRHVAVSSADFGGGLEHFVINGTGREIAADPRIADAVAKRLRDGTGAFTVADGAVRDITGDDREWSKEGGRR